MVVPKFIILHTIWQSVLYVYYPAKEVFVRYDNNGVKKDSWPSDWKRMEQGNYIPVFTAPININSTMHKLRIRINDDSTKDTNWRDLSCPIAPPTTANTDYKASLAVVHFLLFYITLCSSLQMNYLYKFF